MLILIISDNPNSSLKLRHALAEQGHECPPTHVVSYDAALDGLQNMTAEPDLILLAVGSDRGRWESVLKAVRTFQRAKIVAIGPRDPNLILAAIHEGIDDFLDESASLGQQLAKSLGRVAQAGNRRTTQGQTVAVLSASGGTGTTTVAANLAVLLAETAATALLDFDMYGGNAAAFFNLNPRHTIADLCRNTDKLDKNMLGQCLLQHPSGTRVLAAPQADDEVEFATNEAVTRVFRLVRGSFGRIVVDLKDYHRECHRQVLQQSTAILIVSRLDFAAISNTSRLLEYFERLGIDRDRVQLVFNRAGQPHEIPASKVEAVLKLRPAILLPDDPKTANLSINCGNPCVLESPKSKFAAATRALAESVARLWEETPASPVTASATETSRREPLGTSVPFIAPRKLAGVGAAVG
jgi:pilus assembly protein CpaE